MNNIVNEIKMKDMITVRFQIPLIPGSTNSFKDFNPVTNPTHFLAIPKEAGVYIVGVKLDEKFCPLYVGESNNLRNRIKQHWDRYSNGGYLNSKKELWDLTKSMKTIYEEIEIWNRYWADLSNKKMAKKRLYEKLKNVIFFNCDLFFDTRLHLHTGLRVPTGPSPLSHSEVILHLEPMAANYPNISKLLSQINITKDIITKQFYVAYYVYDGIHTDTDLRDRDLYYIESAIKYCLEKNFEIFTYAHTEGVRNFPVEIDISSLSGVIYNEPSKPLIFSM
jgi:hypothetical protein